MSSSQEATDTSGPAPARWPIWPVLAAVGVAIVAGGAAFADWWSAVPLDAQPHYVGRNRCVSCHPAQTQAFAGSHHDRAMDHATPQTVLGDFNDASLEHDGLTSRMFRRDGKFFVQTEGPDGQPGEFEVKYVFGCEPLQQYLVEFDRPADSRADELPRLQVLRESWDTERKRWFHHDPPDVQGRLAAGDDLHWTGVAQRWNNMCADCHSTNVRKNFDVATATYRTTFSEMDVSCEACHGPASIHVELAEAPSLFWDRNWGYGLAKLKDEDPRAQIETCAKCHARRRTVAEGFRPGDQFYDHYALTLIGAGTYFCDGQIEDEDFEHGSFAQSKMYHKGIRCTDCHNPHTARLKEEGNKLCTSCHQHPAGKYDVSSHTMHKAGTAGSACVDCHMPQRTYMEVDPRRDHSLRVPRPDLSAQLGTPNACTQCHLKGEDLPAGKKEIAADYAQSVLLAQLGDTDLQAALRKVDRWAAEKIETHFGPSRATPTVPDPAPFAPTFAAAFLGQRDAESGLLDIARNKRYPAMVRASAIAQLGQYASRSSWEGLRTLLEDPDPAVRAAAAERWGAGVQGALGAYQEVRAIYEERKAVHDALVQRLMATGQSDPEALRGPAGAILAIQGQVASTRRELQAVVDTLAPLLADPIRLVRTAATQSLVAVPEEFLAVGQRELRSRGIEEVKAGLRADNDRAGAHVALGSLEEQLGNHEAALDCYRTALRLEPGATGARSNLSALLERMAERLGQVGRATDAELLLSEIKTLRAEELALIEHDVKQAPPSLPVVARAALLYRYGLSLHLNGRSREGAAPLTEACRLQPEVADYWIALARLEERLENWPAAIAAAEQLVKLEPAQQGFAQLRDEIRAKAAAARPLGPARP